MKRFLPLLLIALLIGGVIFAQNSDPARREALRQLAADAGRGEAKALYQLAKLHDTGYDSIPVDSIRSTALYMAAAEKGYAPAMNFIGFRYYKGEGVPRDIDSALYWINRAAYQGDITAAANLGYLLSEASDIARNDTLALDWIAIAADGGVPQAQIALAEVASRLATPKAKTLLGEAYSKAMGVEYNHEKSVGYFHEAAQEGNPSAQFIVAELLDFFPDLFPEETAEYWYEKAAESGVTDSESAYRALYAYPAVPEEEPASDKTENEN